MSVRRPASASCNAEALAIVVFPTPPFPVKKRKRVATGSHASAEGIAPAVSIGATVVGTAAISGSLSSTWTPGRSRIRRLPIEQSLRPWPAQRPEPR